MESDTVALTTARAVRSPSQTFRTLHLFPRRAATSVTPVSGGWRMAADPTLTSE